MRHAKIWFIAATLAAATPAFAKHWGSDEDAMVCAQAVQDSKSWGGWQQDSKLLVDALGSGKVSPECKAEIDKRAQACRGDAEFMKRWKNQAARDPSFCTQRAFLEIVQIQLAREATKKQDEEKAAAEEKRKAAEAVEIAARELPKASKRDPALEKGIAATYKEEFPDHKVLKVILQDTGWTTERNDYGTVIGRNIDATVVNQKDDKCELYSELWSQEYVGGKFANKIEERGAGSLERKEILCSKVK